MKSSSDVQPHFYTFFAIYLISEINDDLLFVSHFPCLLRHPAENTKVK